MPQQGFLDQKPRSAGSLVVVIALHAAAITALALSKMEVVPIIPPPIDTYNVRVDPPPPEIVDTPKPKAQSESVIETVPPVAPTPVVPDEFVFTLPDLPSIPSGVTIGDAPPAPPLPPAPPAPPVRTEAQIDRSSVLQPPYPASEQRAGNEGSVTIRLVIGADGRVKSAGKVRATSDAFYRATERHALRHWRFDPATLDGRPVQSTRTMTVHFELNG